jgi:hypothetical protein
MTMCKLFYCCCDSALTSLVAVCFALSAWCDRCHSAGCSINSRSRKVWVVHQCQGRAELQTYLQLPSKCFIFTHVRRPHSSERCQPLLSTLQF